MAGGMRKAIWLAIIAAVLLSFAWREHGKTLHSPQHLSVNYNSSRICDQAFDQNLDFSKLHDNHFEITPKEGCFGGWIQVPSAWKDWHFDATGDTSGGWVALWFPNDLTGTPPSFANERRSYNKPAHEPFRLQGRGTFVFYTNQPPRTMEPATRTRPSGPLDPVPDKDGVYKPGNGVISPVIISKVEPEYSEGARRLHWTGTVVATGVVREDGTITQIRIPNSPGMGLDDKIVEALSKWKFKPGELDGMPVPVRMEIAIKFQEL